MIRQSDFREEDWTNITEAGCETRTQNDWALYKNQKVLFLVCLFVICHIKSGRIFTLV